MARELAITAGAFKNLCKPMVDWAVIPALVRGAEALDPSF